MKRLYYILTLLTLVTMISCEKNKYNPVTSSGRILHSKDSTPVANTSFLFNYENTGFNDIDRGSVQFSTDVKGNFSVTYDANQVESADITRSDGRIVKGPLPFGNPAASKSDFGTLYCEHCD